jgi:MscS family membrane protein
MVCASKCNGTHDCFLCDVGLRLVPASSAEALVLPNTGLARTRCQHSGSSVQNTMSTRGFRAFLLGVLAVLMVMVGPRSALFAAATQFQPVVPQDKAEVLALGDDPIIPITEQPFYPELLAISRHWAKAPLNRVVGDSPRATLLNFYAVMARVSHELQLINQMRDQERGLFWSPAARQRIEDAEELFSLAVQALDATVFPESVRDDMAQEAAIELKEVLDYVLTHSTVPILIPDQAGLKALNDQRSSTSESWTLPLTTITLSSKAIDADGAGGFLFAGTTVRHVGRMFDNIRGLPEINQPFASPNFYANFIYTPGFLSPPLWYVKLPLKLRGFLEMALDGQTLLQIISALVVLVIYGVFLVFLLKRLLHTYHYWQGEGERRGTGRSSWFQDHISWYRVLLSFPLLPLTRFSEVVIDDFINVTGVELLVVTYLLFVCYFLVAAGFSFFVFEAVGCSLSGSLVEWRGGGSDLQLRRVSNLVMPICRVLGGIVAVVMIYRLLVVLGLPATTVLAFSAVPGLAIGLGASKLLGNLFGGLSIQTDRPVRVGEFCRIGENLGFVSKIGMRSLELQTLESRVTIPNAIVDEQTIVNFSRRQPGSDELPTQSLLLRLIVTRKFNPDQIADLLRFARLAVVAIQGVEEPLVSVEEDAGEGSTLLCHCQVNVQSWGEYIAVRERILLRLEEVVEQIHLCQRQIGVSYDTSVEQLGQIPALIRDLVERDPLLNLRSCRLMTIAAFSYEFSFRFHAHHATLSAIKDAINRLNKDLLACFAAEGIEIPYPTAVEIRKEA